jgi:ABC-type multidrug transport system ATPase subunit
MLQLKQVIKRWENFQLGPIDLQVHTGKTLAVFGTNGAGKSTMFSLITGQIDSDGGDIIYNEQKISVERPESKKNIGYQPQELQLPEWNTPEELLLYSARLRGIPNPQALVNETIKYWDIEPFRQRALAACSYGMTKRAMLAFATLHQPNLLILDEPFNGLDILHVKRLNQYLETRKSSGLTTILSTHVPYTAAKLCDRAVLISNGKLTDIPMWNTPGADRIQMIEDLFP